MIKLILLAVLCLLATASLEEVSNSPSEAPSSNDNSGTTKQQWLQQLGLRSNNRKPCPRRRNNNPDEWVPSYSSKIVRPLYEPNVLQPQALKNEENTLRDWKLSAATDNDQVHGQWSSPSSSISRNDDDDCDDQLDSNTNAENTAIKILKDCLKKKKNKLESLKRDPSRRFMSDSDSNDNDNNYAREDSDVDDLMDHNEFDDNEERRSLNHFRPSQKESGLIANSDQQTGIKVTDNSQNLNKLRICYACSTATNPSCWEPNSRTTIKYCTKEHSCVTKTFGVKNQVTLIRDCANTCKDMSVSGIEPKYTTCNICHDDYCNSAMDVAINIYSLGIVLIISIVKCTY